MRVFVTGATGLIGSAVVGELIGAGFLDSDIPASSALTRDLVGWEPAHPGLIEDLERGHYFQEARV